MLKNNKDKARLYFVGLISGLVHQMENRKRGDVLECEVNEAAIYTAVNRGVLVATSEDKTEDREKAIAQFKADVAGEDKAVKAA